MEVSKKHTALFHSVSVTLLIALLLLSPCKVRNLIQAEIGVTTTAASNKSKSTLSKTACVTAKEIATISSANTAEVQLHAVLPTPISFCWNAAEIKNQPCLINASQTRRNKSVPLYILYQNFRDHLPNPTLA